MYKTVELDRLHRVYQILSEVTFKSIPHTKPCIAISATNDDISATVMYYGIPVHTTGDTQIDAEIAIVRQLIIMVSSYLKLIPYKWDKYQELHKSCYGEYNSNPPAIHTHGKGMDIRYSASIIIDNKEYFGDICIDHHVAINDLVYVIIDILERTNTCPQCGKLFKVITN